MKATNCSREREATEVLDHEEDIENRIRTNVKPVYSRKRWKTVKNGEDIRILGRRFMTF